MEIFKVTDKRQWYREVYLKSDHWKELRSRKLAINPVCEVCGSSRVDVHHTNYRNIFDVTLGDLITACRPCHCNFHHKQNPGGFSKSNHSGVKGKPIRKPVEIDLKEHPRVTVIAKSKKCVLARVFLERATGKQIEALIGQCIGWDIYLEMGRLGINNKLTVEAMSRLPSILSKKSA